MRVTIFGATGRLGVPLTSELHAHGHSVRTVDRSSITDLCQEQIRRVLARTRPELVVNCLAIASPRDCDDDPPDAFRCNTHAAAIIASAAATLDASVVYLSGNVVFGGAAGAAPDGGFAEHDTPAPDTTLARSKHGGECATRAANRAHYIVRTSWLFGNPDRPTLVDHIRASLRESRPLTMTADSIANPSYVRDVAAAVAALLDAAAPFGTYHAVNQGSATPLDLYTTIGQLTGAQVGAEDSGSGGGPRDPATPLRDTRLAMHLLPGITGIRMRPWRDALTEYLTGPDTTR